jgi:hypothetical protein
MSTEDLSSVHNYSWADDFLSEARLARYLSSAQGSYSLALDAYTDDLRALCEITVWINLFEVALRSAITKKLEATLAPGSGEWFQNIEIHLITSGKAALSIARKRVAQSGAELSAANITAALSLGFWVNLLARNYETSLWTPALHKAFPNLRRPNRQVVHLRLSEICRLRNHVAHQGLITVDELAACRAQIIEVIYWMSEEGHNWAQSSVPALISWSKPKS